MTKRGTLPPALPLLLLVAAAALVRLALIGRPFGANNESTACGPLLCVARNYIRYGAGAAYLAGIMNTGWIQPESWSLYAHHPPLVPLLIAAVQSLAGVSEWSSRLVPSCFSVASTALLYLILAPRFGVRVGIAAGLFHAFCPFTLVFGGMPDYLGPQVVFFGLAAIESYVRWSESGLTRWAVALVASLLLGALSDWPIFYLVPLFAAHDLSRRGHSLVKVGTFLAAASAALVGLVWWLEWSGRGRDYGASTGGDFSFLHQLTFRTIGRLDGDRNPITLRRWFDSIAAHGASLHTWPVLVLAALYVGQTLRRVARREWAELRRHLAPLLLLLWAAMHLGLAIQGNFQHPWWSALFTPGLAAAAALAIEALLVACATIVLRRDIRVASAAIAVAIFLASSAWVAYRYATMVGSRDESEYTLKALGLTIRAVAGEGEGVLTSEWNPEPALWFYADRQLRPVIMSVEDLDRSLASGPYDLPYHYVQRAGPAPRWFVMPAPHRETLAPLAAALDARFPRRSFDAFLVYQLY